VTGSPGAADIVLYVRVPDTSDADERAFADAVAAAAGAKAGDGRWSRWPTCRSSPTRTRRSSGS